MEDYGLLGRVLSFGGGIHTKAVVEKDGLIFNISGDFINLSGVDYADDNCKNAIIERGASILRGLGTVLAGISDKGALYVLNNGSKPVILNEAYGFKYYDHENDAVLEEPKCVPLNLSKPFTGFTVNQVETPDFIKMEVNMDVIHPITFAYLRNAVYIKKAD
ncbi:hypothetical protein J8L98_03355 [Pseudoalteromonas sp. MMG013]|uniref:hypothetical protein n=1 Tax=Pseudoalteromonas sp. MMG013 TaxID=2822687 RepID=UPI001B363217|nr:hypothetical protein [Pseudoalteromonas sp. MMG013]MBQ4860733.1 hypothetical protein [Pseudoalteromonas sp. MMG013]